MSQNNKFREKIENSISGVRAISPQASTKGNQPTSNPSTQIDKPSGSASNASTSQGK